MGECTIDYLMETTCIYILLYYVFDMVNFMCLFIIMLISVKRHELWCTVEDIRLSKCSIIIIIIKHGDVQTPISHRPSFGSCQCFSPIQQTLCKKLIVSSPQTQEVSSATG